MNPKIDLSGLRDLHIPQDPGFWPPSNNLWIVLALCVVLIIFVAFAIYLWQLRPVIYAIKQYKKIAQKTTDNRLYLKEVSQLLRQVAIAVYGRTKIAPLSDQTWQDFLIHAAPDVLPKDLAHLISFAPYQTIEPVVPRERLNQLVPSWIKKVFKNKNSS